MIGCLSRDGPIVRRDGLEGRSKPAVARRAGEQTLGEREVARPESTACSVPSLTGSRGDAVAHVLCSQQIRRVGRAGRMPRGDRPRPLRGCGGLQRAPMPASHKTRRMAGQEVRPDRPTNKVRPRCPSGTARGVLRASLQLVQASSHGRASNKWKPTLAHWAARLGDRVADTSASMNRAGFAGPIAMRSARDPPRVELLVCVQISVLLYTRTYIHMN